MKKSTIIKVHLAYWGIYFFNHLINSLLAPTITDQKAFAYYNVVMASLIPIFFYISYVNVFKFIKNKKMILTALGVVLVMIASVIVIKIDISMYFFRFYILLVTWTIYGALFRFFIDWANKDRMQLQQSKQNLKSELALLRNQINPHFLFNSLHNIDTLIAKDPQKASYSLLQLSDMLRYSFNEADCEEIELDKEVEYLKKYLNLQNLRTSNSELVEFNISIENPNTKIAPMLLIPFVENAFKHTTDKDKKQGITITLNEKSGIINFKVSNLHDPEKMISKDSSKGIGISNVSKRMEILYPCKHKLNISHDSELFKAELTIDTNASS
jgi:LytS/YehU family sensor histidine kinase